MIRASNRLIVVPDSASLLGADFARMGEEVDRAQDAGVDSFQVDFMDGHYVPKLALAPYHLAVLHPRTELPFQIHLELANPDQLLDTFMPFLAGTIIVQYETCPDPLTSFERIRQRQAKIGLGLLPLAPIGKILGLLDQIDMLLLLGVEPGFGGQPMLEGVLPWLAEIRDRVDQQRTSLPITIDGGVNLSNAAVLVEAGADVLILGSTLFGSTDMTTFVQ